MYIFMSRKFTRFVDCVRYIEPNKAIMLREFNFRSSVLELMTTGAVFLQLLSVIIVKTRCFRYPNHV